MVEGGISDGLLLLLVLVAILIVVGGAWLFLSRLTIFILLTLRLNGDIDFQKSIAEYPKSKKELVLGLLSPLVSYHRLGAEGREVREKALSSLIVAIVVGSIIGAVIFLEVVFLQVID